MKKLLTYLSIFTLSTTPAANVFSCSVKPLYNIIYVGVRDISTYNNDTNNDEGTNYETGDNSKDMSINQINQTTNYELGSDSSAVITLVNNLLQIFTFSKDKYVNQDDEKYKEFIKMAGQNILDNYSFEAINNKASDISGWSNFYSEYSGSENIKNTFVNVKFNLIPNYDINNPKDNSIEYAANTENNSNFIGWSVKRNDDKFITEINDDGSSINSITSNAEKDNSTFNNFFTSYNNKRLIGGIVPLFVTNPVTAPEFKEHETDDDAYANLTSNGIDLTQDDSIYKGNNYNSDGLIDSTIPYYINEPDLCLEISFKSINKNETYVLNMNISGLTLVCQADVIDNTLAFIPVGYVFYNNNFLRSDSNFETLKAKVNSVTIFKN